MKERLKIFVSAYACEPGLGSEIGVGWHWVLEMSRYFELWVLTRKSNQYTIESWITERPEYKNIHFLYYDWPKWARFWKKGLRGVRTYYNIWQACTNTIVKRTMQENNITLFHHLTYGNVLWKVSKYGQKQFFIWGPVGGLETIPSEFSKYYDCKWRVIECMRRWVVRTLPMNFCFRNRCRNANLILCKTDITRSAIPEEYRNKAVLQTDVAVEDYIQQEAAVSDSESTIEFVSVGRLDAWRGFDLCIESLARASKLQPNIHLTIVGKGSDELRLKQLATDCCVADKVTFTGQVDRETYQRLLRTSDVVLNASLKEGAVTVAFDSMAMGKPLICLDSTGYTRYFCEEYAVLIPIQNRQQVLEDLKEGMIKLCDESIRRNMGDYAREAGKKFTWETRGKEISQLFTEKIQSC